MSRHSMPCLGCCWTCLQALRSRNGSRLLSVSVSPGYCAPPPPPVHARSLVGCWVSLAVSMHATSITCMETVKDSSKCRLTGAMAASSVFGKSGHPRWRCTVSLSFEVGARCQMNFGSAVFVAGLWVRGLFVPQDDAVCWRFTVRHTHRFLFPLSFCHVLFFSPILGWSTFGLDIYTFFQHAGFFSVSCCLSVLFYLVNKMYHHWIFLNVFKVFERCKSKL